MLFSLYKSSLFSIFLLSYALLWSINEIIEYTSLHDTRKICIIVNSTMKVRGLKITPNKEYLWRKKCCVNSNLLLRAFLTPVSFLTETFGNQYNKYKLHINPSYVNLYMIKHLRRRHVYMHFTP